MKSGNKPLFFYITLIFLLSLSSCARVMGPDYEAQLADTQWALNAYGDADSPNEVLEGSNVTLQFKPDGLAGGSGGCNVYSTQVEVINGEIRFMEIEATLRACLDGEVAAQESAYFNALQSTTRYERTDDHLRIWYDNGQHVLVFDQVLAPGE